MLTLAVMLLSGCADNVVIVRLDNCLIVAPPAVVAKLVGVCR